MQKNIFGKRSEIIAMNFLKKKGYKILETNYKNTIGEIDIIAKDNDYIVFVEVKGRISKKDTPADLQSSKSSDMS